MSFLLIIQKGEHIKMIIVNDKGLVVIDICMDLYPSVYAEIVYVEDKTKQITYVVESGTTGKGSDTLIVNTLSSTPELYLVAGLSTIIAKEMEIPRKEVYDAISKEYNKRILKIKDECGKYLGVTGFNIPESRRMH